MRAMRWIQVVRVLHGGGIPWNLALPAALLFCAAWVAGAGAIEYRLLARLLYLQGADPEVHRVSANPERLYELIPKARHVYPNGGHPLDPGKRDRTVTINSLGFRDRERAPDKRPGVFRIIILGGSNTYGAAVGDEDTYPAQMQRLLDERNPGRFEVWNAGVCAYVLTQELAWVREIDTRLDPDLLIFQVINYGRRAFFSTASGRPAFERNPDLWPENVPFPFSNGWNLGGSHAWLLRCAPPYRLLLTLANAFWVPAARFQAACDARAELTARDRLEVFMREHARRRIFFFSPVARRPAAYRPVEVVPLNLRPFREEHPEFLEIHPPSYVYREYARQLIELLGGRGLLPAREVRAP